MEAIRTRVSELKSEIEMMKEIWFYESMPNETFAYFEELKKDLAYLNMLLANPSLV